MFLRASLLFASLVFATCALAQDHVPNALVWQYNDQTLSRKQYLKDIDFIHEHLDIDILAVAPLENVNVEDRDQFYDSFMEMVKYARSKGIRVVLRRDPGLKGFFNASVNGADEGTYMLADPSDAQGLAYEDEVTANAEGFACVEVNAKWARNKVRPLYNTLLRVYAFDKLDDGFYRPGSLVDITDKARVVSRTSRRQRIEIEAGAAFAGKTFFVLTCQYFNYRDLFGGKPERHNIRVMDYLADIPLAGFYQDETGYITLNTSGIWSKKEPAWRARFYSPAMEKEWHRKHGTDLIRTLLDMRYAPQGDEKIRICAINRYMEFMRLKPVEIERTLVKHQKRVWGEDVFLACHNTFHNNLAGDEVWRTGCTWWDLPRDYGFTDEHIDYPTRMGVLFAAKKTMLMHMFYSKDANEYYNEMIKMAPFNGRVFQHAYNDGVWGLGFNETKTPFLRNIRRLTRTIRHLDSFQIVPPRMDVLLVFGAGALFNWYPDKASRNEWDINGTLRYQEKAQALWNEGYRCALIPDTMIENGRLTVKGNQFVFNGHTFRHCIYLHPRYAKKQTYAFLNDAAAAGLSLAVAGEAKIDFDAEPAAFRGKWYKTFSPEILSEMKVEKSAIPGGAVLADGSFSLVGSGILDGKAEKFDFTVDGVRYTGSHTGLLAYRADGAAFATPGSTLFRDGKRIALSDLPQDAPKR